MANSTKPTKPKKPYPDFPLFPHATRRWAKKIRGKLHYFGRWDAPDAALSKYLDQRDDLHAGRVPRTDRDGLTIHQLCNRFIEAKNQQVDAGDITARTCQDYHTSCVKILKAFGKNRLVDDLTAEDFEKLRATLAKTHNPNSLGNEVTRIRVCFNYAYQSGLIDRPIRYGPLFKRPAKRILRAERQKRGIRMFEARQIRRLLKGASPPMRAMILLAANTGFGNTDCGRLPLSALDLKTGWVNFPRPKTAIERRAKLWPETVEAINDYLAVRPQPLKAEYNELVFITRWGKPWAKGTAENPIYGEFKKMLLKLGLHRPQLGFYALRHGFETIAGETADQVAVNAVMGHVDGTMAGVYRERISDKRLENVSHYVRRWLFRKGHI
ncbi:tyrosine-type recombinase/integrase [Bythopirellula polymerisocia]|uniref:Site-specific tyrosine recombinase XerC n=1 Tax=Bythopirellula polymerisocia TaxID=2528003 RepID=A0A5C6C865_9BACT|nr:tyrosine-type recombinase/integrase [Bythopirellula polymerisocia]TWU20358.1 site-specific tyrosine recombinase XerC [Bythopirellula polymerisocia]